MKREIYGNIRTKLLLTCKKEDNYMYIDLLLYVTALICVPILTVSSLKWLRRIYKVLKEINNKLDR